MTQTPRRIYGPVEAVNPQPEDTAYFCVDCSLRGSERPLLAMYQVSGTILCREHALEWRKAASTRS